jgi:membrane protein DedA with SNARE-associated domain
VNTILHILEHWGYIGVAAAIFFEDFGIPLPGETVLILAGIAASQGRLNILLVALLAFVAAVAGDNVGFLIGHFGGRPLITRVGCRIRIGKHYLLPPSRVAHAERTFKRHGAWIITVARFIDILRQLNGIIAGSLRTHWLKFLTYNVLGAALWVGLWSGVSYFAGSRIGNTPGQITRVLLYVLAGSIGLALMLYAARRIYAHFHPDPDGSDAEDEESCRLLAAVSRADADDNRDQVE